MRPTVSLLFAFHNSEKTLGRLLDSVRSIKFCCFEVVAIDDGSTDNSVDILLSYDLPNVKLLRQSNLGLTKSLNIGLTHSSGIFIARIDSDDQILPDRLQRQYDLLTQNVGSVICSCDCDVIDEVSGRIVQRTARKELSKLRYTNIISHSTVMFRKEAILSVGGYNETYYTSQDYDLWLRLYNKFGSSGFLHVDECLVRRYIADTCISSKHWLQQVKNGYKIRASNNVNIIINLLSTAYHFMCSAKYAYAKR